MGVGMKTLALIPARGGSKGLPNKNIRTLFGKPLIAWTIEAARGSKCIDRVVVSTDSTEIADVARQFGAEVPFLRPAELSTDKADSMGVIWHALEACPGFDAVVFLQPTSPLRGANRIDEGFNLWKAKGGSVVGVAPFNHHPAWSFKRLDDGRLDRFMPEFRNVSRRQDLPDAYLITGALYISGVSEFLRSGTFFGEKTYSLEMTQEESIDIDTVLDFQIAEMIMTTKAMDGTQS
jgi:CMP-N-acetylneuraminic acid synthetase